jgi:hypothetical protein
MYPYIDFRERKVELTTDDVEGVQLLYGSDPDLGMTRPRRRGAAASWLS